MSNLNKFQSFEQLFEKINFKKGQEGRSVYSPAAYLSDLLQLLEDRFTGGNKFFDRRSDVKDIPLNGENAFSEVAYLDIVNRILEKKIDKKTDKNAYDNLREETYPFYLPFDLEQKKYLQYLKFLEVAPSSIYQLFAEKPEAEVVAKSYLKLTNEELNVIIQEPTDVEMFFKNHFGLDSDFHAKLSDLESFLEITNISLEECHALLYQNLSSTTTKKIEEETETKTKSEVELLANNSFINHGTNGYAFLENEDTKINWGEIKQSGGESDEPNFLFSPDGVTRLQRASRLIRLSKKLNMSIIDLELILRTLCGNNLNGTAIQTIAVVKQVQDRFDLPIDECCALVVAMNNNGLGNEKEPIDLFNRVYNNSFTDFDPKYILGSGLTPMVYSDSKKYQAMWASGDILSPENADYRKRIGKALHISERNLVMIVEKFRSHFGETDTVNNVFHSSTPEARPMLDVLYRMSKLVEILDISFEELFHIFDILEKDSSIRKFALFSVLISYNPAEVDCYKIIQGEATAAINASLWLTQILIGVTYWMQESDFTGEELKQILTGKPADEKSAKLLAEQRLVFLNTLYGQIKPAFFSYQNFTSEQFNSRSSRSIFRTVSDPSQNVISEKDHRLVHFDKTAAKKAAEQAVENLDVFSKEDFLGLGIEEKMVDKVFNNLIIKGYINEEGGLIESAFPKEMADFKINSSSVDEKKALFETIQQLVQEEYEDNNTESSGVNVAVYLSDFEDLDLPESRLVELYDNLIFNGYMDEEGNLVQPDFFIKKENAEEFEPNANIDIYSQQVYKKIKTKIDCFHQEKLILKSEHFSSLPLKAIEVEDLIENLRFNEYLDEQNAIVDKNKILELSADDMNLAIQFYTLRHQILTILQEEVVKFKVPYFTLSREILGDVGEAIVAEMIFHELERSHLEDGQMTMEGKLFFADEENVAKFHIGPYFTDIFHQTVFKTVQQIIDDYQQYQVNEDDLIALDLEEDDIEEIMDILEDEGFLEAGLIKADQRAYFLNINNALTFEIEGYADFSKDIFFILQAVALKTEEAVSEIYENIKEASAKQHDIVMSSLGEYAEVSAEIAEVILSHLFKNNPNLVEAIALPILKQVDEKDRITSAPKHNAFKVALQRLKQTALLVSKLQLNQAETEVVFNDQSLAEKFPEKLHLPASLNNFDALLDNGDTILVFKNRRYWTYSKDEYVLLESEMPLSNLSENFETLSQIDAAFTDASGKQWLIGRRNGEMDTPALAMYFCKNEKTGKWETKEKLVGKVKSNFDTIENIDASFVDQDGKIYLFAGNQYMRYSDDLVADEGYPKMIKGNWINELDYDLPEVFYESIDASFTNLDGVTFIFKDDQFISSEDPLQTIPINAFWGKVKNNFNLAEKVDAAFVHMNNVYFFSGNQVVAYSDSIENDGVIGVEGSLTSLKKLMPGLPDDFETGIDAMLKGADDLYYVFKEKKFAVLNIINELNNHNEDDVAHEESKPKPIELSWGRVKNNLALTGRVDAALAGLDGRTYLFSGTQYYRYSKADYSKVDEGYPHTISKDWGELEKVDSAFVLDGKTYLFGRDENDNRTYVRYSTNDYTLADEGFPKDIDDNWWNLPNKLIDEGFNIPDAVFVGNDGNSYLFKGVNFVSYDTQHRWWSEPQKVAQRFDSIPFSQITAAFTGKDGRTYMFEGGPMGEMSEGEVVPSSGNGNMTGLRFIRYTDKNYNKIDDRYPKSVKGTWGKVVNNIQKTKMIDAAVSLLSHETIVAADGTETPIENTHTYLFSGNQFFRYTGNSYEEVDEGYPKTIQTALKEEPRFKNMTTDFSTGVDAAFADQRNVYLFRNGECTIVSEEKNKTYTRLIDTQISTAFIDEGSIYGMTRDAWFHLSALENDKVLTTKKTPSVLHDVPSKFQTGVDAVLQGIDDNTYIFKGKDCYNVSLEKEYPIGEEWGKSANLFQMEGNVDAGFVGRDGKTYLFSGDQFISYTPAKGVSTKPPKPPIADNGPQSISKYWGGLTNVWVAFVKDEKTYLCEAADEHGNFRYLCYSSEDYTKPDTETPITTDIYWWDMPEDYIEEGFDSVNAVLFEEDNMFLLNDESFVQYNKTEEIWTYPKPIRRIWRNLPDEHAKFENVKAAFTGSDDVTYFFSENTFVEYKNPSNGTALPIQNIESHWGIDHNNIVQGKNIDAAVVINNQTTFLFSGDQYIRYSSDDYQFMDEEYPKLIIGNLRMEKGFEKISMELEEALGSNKNVTAILANQNNIYIFENENCHVFSESANRTYLIDRIGYLKNNISENNKVDAAYLNQEDQTFLFSGDQYYKYSTFDYDWVDEGYPKSIIANLSSEIDFKFLYNFLDRGVDAIFKAPNESVYVFKDKLYQTSQRSETTHLISGMWVKVNNQFTENVALPTVIDAAFTAPSGKTYFFKGNQYVCYSNLENEFVDEGFPKKIKDNWGNLFTGLRSRKDIIGDRDFEAKIDSAWFLEGHTYFGKGDEYVRYSNSDFTMMDSIYPQKFVTQWTDRNDFLLNDLRIVSRYKELNDQYQGGDMTLTDFFYEGIGYQKEPFQILADIFDWNVEEVKWLKRNNVFLRPENEMEVSFDMEQVLGMYDIFAVANKVGATPSALYEKVWVKMFVDQNVKSAATALYAQLGMNNSETDWKILSRQMHDEMNLIRRDALMPYLIHILPEEAGVEDARDLFEHLLIDVEMGSDAKTSNIKEATAAVQLYFHRYFVSLEETKEIESENDIRDKEELKEWWKWMKNYRVWEANRKVFLYPENYIRPELRDTKTAEFKQLEDALLQGMITPESVESNYKNYIDTFSVVGNLKIAGGNVYKDERTKEDVLLLFGHSRTEPAEYYFRTARFEGDVAEWGAWEKTELNIKSDRVFPIFANGRVLVFWIEIEEYEDSKGTLSRQKGQKDKQDQSQVLEVNTSNTIVKHRAHVKFSYLNHSKRWSPPQNLRRGIDVNYKLDATYVEKVTKDEEDINEIRIFTGEYCLTSSKKNPAGDIKFIEEYPEYENLPDDFKLGLDSITTFKGKRYYFKGSKCVIQNIADGKWVKFDKGSSLVDTPIKISANELISTKGQLKVAIMSINIFGLGFLSYSLVEENKFEVPEYFDAAFNIDDEVLCLIDQEGNYTFFQEGPERDGGLVPLQENTLSANKLNSGIDFSFFVHTIANKGGQFAPADGVFKEEGAYYVLRNGQYECYDIDDRGMLKAREGFPKSIKGNLAFNMDKFFNRLHLVWHEAEGGNISINYTTSRGDLLLSGKLAPDFIFEEVAFSNNLEEQFIKDWKKILSNNFSPNYDEKVTEQAIELVDDSKTSISDFIDSTEFLDSVHQGNKSLLEAIRLSKDKDSEDFPTVIEKSKTSLNVIKKGHGNVLNKIKEYADKLEKAYNAWNTSDEDSEATAKSELEKLRKEILKYERDSVKQEIEGKIIQLSKDLQLFKDKMNDSIFSKVIANHILIIKNSQKFNEKVAKLGSSVETIAGSDNSALITELKEKNEGLRSNYDATKVQLQKTVNLFHFNGSTLASIPKLSSITEHLKSLYEKIDRKGKGIIPDLLKSLKESKTSALEFEKTSEDWTKKMILYLSAKEEELFGRFDLFHKKTDFGITNTSSNFSFGLVDWYVFEKAGGTFLCRPIPVLEKDNEGKEIWTSSEDGQYEIIRLTTNSAYQLSSRLFIGGIKELLELDTQSKTMEAPKFGKDISYNEGIIEGTTDKRIYRIPTSDHLDFQGANSVYYWELFFHAPFLIAQALNTAQKFDEAKEWYEFIFDPTKGNKVWRFLPFDDEDIEKNFISNAAQLKKYYNDPFDPHAIAGLRINAYRKAIVMNYIDNLLDWGDMLFRQYTMESINEARMLYILAYDLLGKKPQSAGTRILTPDQTYQKQKEVNNIDLDIWDLENEPDDGTTSELPQKPLYTIHASNLSAYFFIPENDLFIDYWDRVEDRLYKIRQSLNIKGIKQPLPLFQPPIDPMALVLAASSGAGIGSAMSSMNVAVPHYRFSFTINKAKELVDKLNQFGGELLGTLEKKDAEELGILQTRQEGIILKMSRELRESQLTEAENQLKSLKQNLDDAKRRLKYHEDTIEVGAIPAEEAQMALMGVAAAGHVVATIFNVLSAIAYPFPKAHLGPFTIGTTVDPGDIGEGLAKIGETASTASEGISILGELAGMVAQQERMLQDWEFQRDATKFEIEQMDLEIEGAELQIKMAALEIQIYEKEVEHQESIQSFYKEKFSNLELYQWMASRMSSLYFQTYKLAYDMAKYAEKAFQYERGIKAAEVNFIQPNYWNSQRKGLMAGENLGMDLERMEQAFFETHERRLEIAKNISLLELDPVAYLNLLKKGVCDFRLSEALFDYDYQGHYCRQIKTITLTITAGEGQTVNATLTQLNHSTVMEPDTKAVKFLLNPKDKQPLSIRNNWRANQQIAISHVDQYADSNGMFELRFDDERYLPFEGTGAVSTWRLELNGKRGSYKIKDITDIVMNIKYTAIQGGEAFGNAVKGLLKPYPTAEMIDFEKDFADEWADFLDGDANDFSITMTKDYFPNMGSNKITGMLAKFDLVGDGQVQMMINRDDSLTLKDGKHLETPGLSISNRGSIFNFTLKGNKANLTNMKLVMAYKAKV